MIERVLADVTMRGHCLRKLLQCRARRAFSAACGSEAPVGPGTVIVTQTTSTTTTTSTSTSTVAPSLTASFTVSPTTAPTGQQVMVNGSASFAAPGRRIVGFEWDYGDGTKKSGVTSSHDYDLPGTFPIILTVTDDAAQKAMATRSVTITRPRRNPARNSSSRSCSRRRPPLCRRI